MNKSLVLLVFLFVPLLFFGQISIDNGDMPSPGDTIRTSNAINFGSINFEETGPSFYWDFSTLFPITQSVDTFVSVQETPWIYQILFLLSANLAQQLTEFDQFPGFQVTDTYSYFKNSGSNFKEVGFGITMNGIPIPNKYDEPDIIYQFPLNTGDIDSSLSNYEFDIPGIGYYGGWKKRTNKADGWGTITTPYGSFETLRLKSTISQYDSLYVDSLGFGFPFYREYIEYKWLGKEFGIPLCTVTDDGILPTVSYIDSLRTLTTGVNNVIKESDVRVFPNPSSNKVIITYDGPEINYLKVKILNISGEVVMAMQGMPKTRTITIDLKQYNVTSGLYFIRIGLDDTIINKKIMIR